MFKTSLNSQGGQKLNTSIGLICMRKDMPSVKIGGFFIRNRKEEIMAEQQVTHFLKFEQKLKYFEGYISTVECITKDDGALYCKTAIPLKQNKDDEPLWLNCCIFDQALAEDFVDHCRKGTRVIVGGFLKESTSNDGKTYINFYVKNYTLLREASNRSENNGC